MTKNTYFKTASLILGILTLLTFPLIIPALICGPLAIIFAMLSKSTKQQLPLKSWIGTITGTIGLVACLIVAGAALNTTIRTIDWDSMLTTYIDLMDYATTLSDEELLEFMDDVERGDFSDFTDFYDTPIQSDEQIWY
ncbi:MAG: hypothetical protein R3Y47_10210 [Lachnospiraceae bacterium]